MRASHLKAEIITWQVEVSNLPSAAVGYPHGPDGAGQHAIKVESGLALAEYLGPPLVLNDLPHMRDRFVAGRFSALRGGGERAVVEAVDGTPLVGNQGWHERSR